jgi:ribosomal protein S3
MLARAVGGGHSNLQLFQVIFLMRKYRNASLLAEHVAREIGAAKSHSGVLRSIEQVVRRMESIPGLDTGLMIKVSGRINGQSRIQAVQQSLSLRY